MVMRVPQWNKCKFGLYMDKVVFFAPELCQNPDISKRGQGNARATSRYAGRERALHDPSRRHRGRRQWSPARRALYQAERGFDSRLQSDHSGRFRIGIPSNRCRNGEKDFAGERFSSLRRPLEQFSQIGAELASRNFGRGFNLPDPIKRYFPLRPAGDRRLVYVQLLRQIDQAKSLGF